MSKNGVVGRRIPYPFHFAHFDEGDEAILEAVDEQGGHGNLAVEGHVALRPRLSDGQVALHVRRKTLKVGRGVQRALAYHQKDKITDQLAEHLGKHLASGSYT